MHRIIKKYQTPNTTLPGFHLNEDGMFTSNLVQNALASAGIRQDNVGAAPQSLTSPIQKMDGYFSTVNDPNLLRLAADEAAMQTITKDENAAQQKDEQGGSTGSKTPKDPKDIKASRLNTMSNISSAVSNITDLASSFVDVDENSSFQQQQMVGDMLLKSGNPYAMAAGAAFKGLSVMDQALGINVNTINKKEAKFADISKGERILNNVLGFLPGTGAGLLAGKTNEFDYDERLNTLSSSYGNTLDDMRTAEGMSEGRYLFGKQKINDKMNELEEDQNILLKAQKTNTLRQNSDYHQNLAQQNINRYAGNNYTLTAIGKEGMKLMSKEEALKVLESRKRVKEDVVIFKDGGKVNILPEGKLHAHKHHLENVDERLEDLTKKGIPIVAVSEDGQLSQVAEVEKEELILHLELTQQVEDLWEQFKNAESPEEKNRIAFMCGDLLCKEIITNTEDNTNLIKEL